MNGDIFAIKNNTIKLIHSPMRKAKFISGVLVLSGKTYGKFKNKYFYRCIPDDKDCLNFDTYKVQLRFKKHQNNKYVVLNLHLRKKHPMGSLINTIGNVSDLSISVNIKCIAMVYMLQ